MSHYRLDEEEETEDRQTYPIEAEYEFDSIPSRRPIASQAMVLTSTQRLHLEMPNWGLAVSFTTWLFQAVSAHVRNDWGCYLQFEKRPGLFLWQRETPGAVSCMLDAHISMQSYIFLAALHV